MAELIRLLSGEEVFREALLDFLLEEFVEHNIWWRRVVFPQLCSEVASSNALSPRLFSTTLLPSLARLSRDPVSNVRLSVARCLARDILSSGNLPIYILISCD